MLPGAVNLQGHEPPHRNGNLAAMPWPPERDEESGCIVTMKANVRVSWYVGEKIVSDRQQREPFKSKESYISVLNDRRDAKRQESMNKSKDYGLNIASNWLNPRSNWRTKQRHNVCTQSTSFLVRNLYHRTSIHILWRRLNWPTWKLTPGTQTSWRGFWGFLLQVTLVLVN